MSAFRECNCYTFFISVHSPQLGHQCMYGTITLESMHLILGVLLLLRFLKNDPSREESNMYSDFLPTRRTSLQFGIDDLFARLLLTVPPHHPVRAIWNTHEDVHLGPSGNRKLVCY